MLCEVFRSFSSSPAGTGQIAVHGGRAAESAEVRQQVTRTECDQAEAVVPQSDTVQRVDLAVGATETGVSV